MQSVVIYYGTGYDHFENATASHLCHFSEDDPYEPKEYVNQLKDALKTVRRPTTFYTYPNTGHWFAEPYRPDAYDETAAKMTLQRTLSFLREI